MPSTSKIASSGQGSRRWAGCLHQRPPLVQLALLYAAYFLAGGFSQGLALIPGVSIIFWPPVGILIATLLLTSKSAWPSWILAGGLAELTCNAIWFHSPLPLALIYYTANALEALTAAWLIHTFSAQPFRLTSLEDVLAFVVLGAGVAPMVSATIIAVTDALLGKHPFTTAWPLVWLGDSSGLLVSTPLTFALVQAWRDRANIPSRRILESIVIGLLLFGIGALAFRGYLPTAYMLLPPLLWAAARFQLQGATVALGLVTLITAMFTITGTGEFTGDPEAMREKIVMLQAFLGIAAASALLVGVLSLQRQRALHKLRTANDNLKRQVAAQTADIRAREADIQLTVDAVPALIAYINDQFRFRWTNGHYRRWFGLGPEDIAGRHVREILSEPVWEIVRPYMARALAGETVTYESFLPYSTTSPRWVKITYTPDLDPTSRVRGFVSHVVDISDRKQAEERLQLAQKAAHAGIWEVNLDTGEFVADDEALRLHGVPAGTPMSHETALAAVHPDDRPRVEAELRRTREDGTPLRIELRSVHPDGSTHWILSQADRRIGSAPSRLIGLVQDITEHKQIEAALLESEARFRQVVESLAPLVWTCRADGPCDYLSPQWVRYTGKPEAEHLGYGWLEQLHPEDREETITRWQAVAAEGKTFETEFRIRRHDGEYRWFQTQAVPLRDEAGAVIKWFGSNTDITERKQIQEASSQNAALFGEIIEQAPAGMYVVDSQFRLVQVNAKGLPVFASVQPLIGRDFDEVMEILWGPEVGPQCTAIFRHTLATGERYILPRFNEQRHDIGRDEAYEWEVQRVTLPDGQHGVVCYFQNVTERTRRERNLAFLSDLQKVTAGISSAEEIMREVGARLAQLLRLSHCLFVEIDETAEISAVVYDHHAADVQNLVGEYRIGDFHSEEEQQLLRAGKALAITDVRDSLEPAGRAAQFETLGIRAFMNAPHVTDGRWKFLLHGSRSEPTAWSPEDVELIREVTERSYLRIERASAEAVLAETARALTRERERLALAMHTGGLGAYEWQVGENTVWWSAEVYPLFGVDPATFTPTLETFNAMVHPDDQAELWRRTEESLAQRTFFDMEYRVVRPDGAIRWFYNRSQVEADAAGFDRVTGVLADITDRKTQAVALEERSDQLALLSRVSQQLILSPRSEAEVMQTVFGDVARTIGAEMYFNYTPNDETSMRLSTGGGLTNDEWILFATMRYGELLCGRVAVQKNPIVIEDIANTEVEGSEAVRAAGYGAYAGFPLLAGDRLLGTIAFITRTKTHFRPGEVQTIQNVCDQVAATLERARLAAELRAGEERYDLAIRGSNDGIWDWDIVADRSFFSERCMEMWGIEPRDIVPCYETWADRIHPEDRPGVLAALQRHLDERVPYDVEYRARTEQGEWRWFRSRGQAVWDETGRPIRMVSSMTDNNERKRAEQRTRLLSEAAAVLLANDDPDAMLRGLFDKIAPHFGLDVYFNYVTEDDGNCLRMLSAGGITDEERRDFARMEFGQAICGTVAKTRQAIHARCIQQTDDPNAGVVRAMNVRAYTCHPLLADDTLLGTLSFGSRTKDEFEDAELEFLRTICQYVAAAYERMRLVDQLRVADRRKDEFLATLAHELRNPLAPIRNGLAILRMNGSHGQSEEIVGMMDRQLGHMVNLVDDLLDVSRVRTGKITLRNEQLTIREIVDAAVEACRPIIDEKSQALKVDLTVEKLNVKGDQTRLVQVLANLLTNAAKYSEPGGRIGLTVVREGSEALIRVTDTGIGIARELLPTLWDLFTQVRDTLDKAQGGLGIGLSLVKNLVEMHGGTVQAHSAGLGQGSEFVVRLPLASYESPEASSDLNHTSTLAHAPRTTRRRILVVDDNRDSATTLAMLLKLNGNETQTAYDGLEAIETAATFRPDVVLLDIGLPKLNGYEACQRIREQPWSNGMVIVAITGWGQEEDRQKSQDAGFDAHLVKPVDYSVLLKLLASQSPASAI